MRVVLWIRITLNADPYLLFKLLRIQIGFRMTKKFYKFTTEICSFSKILIHLSLGLHEQRPATEANIKYFKKEHPAFQNNPGSGSAFLMLIRIQPKKSMRMDGSGSTTLHSEPQNPDLDYF